MGLFSGFFRSIKRGVKSLISGVGKIVGSVLGFVGNIVEGFLGAFGLSFDLPEYDNPSTFQSENQGVLLNQQSAVKGIPVIYGQRTVGGTRVYMGTSGTNNKYLYVVLAIAEGEIDGFTELYINDEVQDVMNGQSPGRSSGTYGEDSLFDIGQQLTVSATTPINTTSSYFKDGRSLVNITFYKGTEDQTVNTLFESEAPGWNNLARLRGVAYLACRFEFLTDPNFSNPWSGIPTVKVKVRGKKVLQAYGSKDTNNNSSTYETDIGSMVWSDNPADCLLDYLRNPRYGKGLKDNRINFASFSALRSVFNTSYTLANNPAIVTGKLLTCDGVINTEDTMFNNTKRLLQSCRGFLPYVNGKYTLKFETKDVPTNQLKITDDMIIGDINIQSADKNSLYNEAQITYANEDKNYDSDTEIYRDDAALAQDGEPLILTTSHPTLTNKHRIRHFAKWLVDRSRNQLAVSLKITNEGQSIVAGDLVRVEHQYNRTLGGTDKTDYLFKSPTTSSDSASLVAPEMLFRVVSTKLNYDNTVDLQLIEHRNEIYVLSVVNGPEPPICPPGYTYNPTTKQCEFTGGQPVQCPPGFTYNPDTGQCEQDTPTTCPPGYHWDATRQACVPDSGTRKEVNISTRSEASGDGGGGFGYFAFDIDARQRANYDKYKVLVQASRNVPTQQDSRRLSQFQTSNADPRSTLKGEVNELGMVNQILRPGDTIYYRVYLIDAIFLTNNPPIRIDDAPGGEFADNVIGIPELGGTPIIATTGSGGAQTATSGAGPGSTPLNIDEFETNTFKTGYN